VTQQTTIDIQQSRVYNKELSPESATSTWSSGHLFSWWMCAWHSLAGYTMAMGLFAFGITGWQLIVGFIIGLAILYLVNNLSGGAGAREKVPFPVFARGSFGVYGANIPAILRAIVAVAWYGIQTYLASAALKILMVKLIPGVRPLDQHEFLGLSALGWVCFVGLSAIQMAVLVAGLEAVRKLTTAAGATIWAALLALAVWVLMRADWHVNLNATTMSHPSEGTQIYGVFAAAFVTVAYMAGPSLNFPDFTRNAPTARSVRRGNAWGLMVNGSAFVIIATVIALAGSKNGKPVTDLVTLFQGMNSIPLLLVTIIAVGLATVGINIILNYVSPVYDLIQVWPRFLTFKRAGIIVAVLAIVILPWKLYSSPAVINEFIGGVGALMGPLLGIVLVDYYVCQRQELVTRELFQDNPAGRYFYRKGVNPGAVLSLIIAGVIAIVVEIVPALGIGAPFSWPIGLILGGGIYWILNRYGRRRRSSSSVDESVVSGKG
jgi:NCS1 family nucleobase:cation symporter-1